MIVHGIKENSVQFYHQLIQVFYVGITLGTVRTVVPALAEDEFAVASGSFLLLSTFVLAFGVVKACMNFAAGHLSDKFGRKKILLMGWLLALPVPLLILYAESWAYIVIATTFLGINQGLTWSITQTCKIDLATPGERGFAIGLNEFSGYIGVSLAGILTGILVTNYDLRLSLMIFSLVAILIPIVLTLFLVQETLPWVEGEQTTSADTLNQSTFDIFKLVTWDNKQMFLITQAGLIEKFTDTLVWIFFPLYLYQMHFSLPSIGIIVGIYGVTWGASQFLTGYLSDRIGRKKLIFSGMLLCSVGSLMCILDSTFIWWSISAGIIGFGMALLYPTLSAAVSDLSEPIWRSTAIGVYRFWRDAGYAFGAFSLGAIASYTGNIESAFWLVAIIMFASGILVGFGSKETHPDFRN